MKLIYPHSTATKILNCKGFTLVEIMVALAVSGIVMAAIYSAYISQQRSSIAQEQVVEMQQNIRAGLEIMEHEVRMAGYDPQGIAGTGFVNFTAPNTGFTNSLNFSMVTDADGIDNDNDGTTDEAGEFETVQYYVYDSIPTGDGHTALGRRTPIPPVQAVAENIDSIEFYYTLANGTQTTAPTVAQLGDIRAIQISILARAGRDDRDFTNTMTYTTASGVNWGPFNDNFRRRLLITTVQCRNMGL
jgi:type IV pilus assembly protein PilW